MKAKMKGVLGIAFVLVVIASLLAFALPAVAGPYDDLVPVPNMWKSYAPTPSLPGGWFFDPTITKVGPIAEGIDGDLYASVNFGEPLETLGPTGAPNGGSDWATDIYYSAGYSAMLVHDDSGAGSVYVEFTAPGGITLGDLDDIGCCKEWSLWFYLENADPTAGPQLELRFDDPTVGSQGVVDVTLMAAQAPQSLLEEWVKITVTPDSERVIWYGTTEAGVGFAWDGVTVYDFTDALPVIDGQTDDLDASDWVLTRVRVELWEPAAAGDRYCYIDDVTINGVCHHFDPAVTFFKSVDGGRTWASSLLPGAYSGGPVVDMVCSSLSEDVIYVTDGNYVYKSVDGGLSFMQVAQADLEKALRGDCGCPIFSKPITCIDLGYDGSNKPVVFIGTKHIGERVYCDPHPDVGDLVVGSVYWIADEAFPASWHDLQLKCYGCCDPELPISSQAGCFDVYSVGCSPDFASTSKVYALISTLDENCDETANDPATQVVSTVGTTCSWNFVGELFYDCDVTQPFGICHGSRFAFPDDFLDTRTMFIGVTAWNGATTNVPGGDVYMVADTIPLTPTLDLNVKGYSSGCAGLYHANICSLDIMGSTNSAELIAGAYDDYQNQFGVDVYYSSDGGWTWDDSDKDPTGVDLTYVLWYSGTAVAATNGCNCAFSMSCGDEVGKYWNQISLIAMDIDLVLDMSFAPGYLDGSTTMYVLTYDADSCIQTVTDPSESLLRWDGTYWERVYSSLSHEYGIEIDWVEVSPDFNDTDCLYLANSSFSMYRSIDRGCSWRMLAYPCDPTPISAWIVVDEETVLAAGASTAAGTIFRTTRHGTRPWEPFPCLTATGADADDGVDFDLSLPRGATSDVLFSDDNGHVFISYDLGETWGEITDAVGTASFHTQCNTYVVFDPGYGTADDPGESMIYAAGGNRIGRCGINSAALLTKQDWVYISGTTGACDPCTVCVASGIDAAGDTALYVSDAGTRDGGEVTTICGTMAVSYGCINDGDNICTCDLVIEESFTYLGGGTYSCGDPLTVVSYNLYCEDGDMYGSAVVEDLITGAMFSISLFEDLYGCEICDPNGVANIFTVLNSDLRICCTGTADCPSRVWRTLNPMAPMLPAALVEWEILDEVPTLSATSVLLHPTPGFGVYPDDLWLTQGSNVLWALDAGHYTYIWTWDDPLAMPVVQVSPADGTVLTTTDTVTLEWEALDNALMYEVYIYSYCPSCPTLKNLTYTINSYTTCLPLNPATHPLVAGTTYYWKVRVACDSPYVSKWSDLREFSTALGSTTNLCSPICGADDIILTTNFSWDEVIGATGYELQIAAAGADGTVDWTGASTYSSPVNALASIPGLEYSTVYYWRVRAINNGVAGAWAVCIFTTMDEPEVPPEPEPPVEVTIEEVTPTWIWVLIGIGGALMIAVIILIVTTRRVP